MCTFKVNFAKIMILFFLIAMANSYIHKFLFPLPYEVSLTPFTQKRLYYNILDKLSENVNGI